MTRYRAAILGCGGRGQAHAAGHAASPQAEIVGCANLALENARTLAKAYPGLKRIEALLPNLKPEAERVLCDDQ